LLFVIQQIVLGADWHPIAFEAEIGQ